MVVQISILVGNVNDLLELGYENIEIWVSEDEGNSYYEVTSSEEEPAELYSFLPSNFFQAGGKLLKLSLDEGEEESVEFSSLIPLWTATQVANRINEVVPELASVVDGKVRLSSGEGQGRYHSVRVTYCDIPDIGWVEKPFVRGKDSRLVLVDDVLSYTYTDLGGLDRFRYRWRFSQDGSPPTSDFSAYVLGKQPPSIASDRVSVCTMRFVGLDGTPYQQKIIISQVSPPLAVTGFFVNSLPTILESDKLGFLQFTLARGAKVRVAIEGTTFVREFTIPDTATFDLLQAMSDAPDNFSIQVPLPFLIRRSI